MKCIFLVTHKLAKTKTVSVTVGEKDIFALYSPRENQIELLEKVDEPLLDQRVKFWKEQHSPEFIVKPTPEPKPPKKKKRKKYKLSAKARKERSRRMRENNPNKDGLRPQQIEAVRKAMIGNQFAKGYRFSEEQRKWLSYTRKGRQNLKGYSWIYNPYTKQERMIPPGTDLPNDWRYGRNPEYMEDLLMRRLAKRHYDGGW